jgi:hypothetical protein
VAKEKMTKKFKGFRGDYSVTPSPTVRASGPLINNVAFLAIFFMHKYNQLKKIELFLIQKKGNNGK